MTGKHEIFLGNQPIGMADVCREGLYYRFRCICRLTGSVMHRITVTVEKKTHDLGIPVPVNGIFSLERKVPVKNFREGKPVFSAVPHLQKKEGKFYPISPEEPFAYLANLRKAHMERREGIIGIVLEE